MTSRRVMITGIGIVCPLGYQPETILKRLSLQQHGFERLPEFADFKTSKVSVGARIPGFDTPGDYPEDWSSPEPLQLGKETLRALNPHCFYAVYATRQAMRQAGLEGETPDERTGLFTASAGSASSIYRNLKTMFDHGVRRTSPFGIINSVVGTLSYNLGSIFGITGSSCGFASACASSSHALGFAFDEIVLGRQDRVIVVGAEDGNLESVLPFSAMHALSTATDPDAASLPFDRRRSGFVGSGGAATVILESADSAERRGARPLGELLGWGQSSDGYSPAIPEPEGRGLVRGMRLALDHAKLEPAAINYINAHATGTQVGDIAEARAIKSVFGKHAPPVSSTKALTGHTLSMAGALEFGLSLLALNAGFIPGTANLREIDPKCADLNLSALNQTAPVRNFLTNSSGFGGANVCLAARPATSLQQPATDAAAE